MTVITIMGNGFGAQLFAIVQLRLRGSLNWRNQNRCIQSSSLTSHQFTGWTNYWTQRRIKSRIRKSCKCTTDDSQRPDWKRCPNQNFLWHQYRVSGQLMQDLRRVFTLSSSTSIKKLVKIVVSFMQRFVGIPLSALNYVPTERIKQLAEPRPEVDSLRTTQSWSFGWAGQLRSRSAGGTKPVTTSKKARSRFWSQTTEWMATYQNFRSTNSHVWD